MTDYFTKDVPDVPPVNTPKDMEWVHNPEFDRNARFGTQVLSFDVNAWNNIAWKFRDSPAERTKYDHFVTPLLNEIPSNRKVHPSDDWVRANIWRFSQFGLGDPTTFEHPMYDDGTLMFEHDSYFLPVDDPSNPDPFPLPTEYDGPPLTEFFNHPHAAILARFLGWRWRVLKGVYDDTIFDGWIPRHPAPAEKLSTSHVPPYPLLRGTFASMAGGLNPRPSMLESGWRAHIYDNSVFTDAWKVYDYLYNWYLKDKPVVKYNNSLEQLANSPTVNQLLSGFRIDFGEWTLDDKMKFFDWYKNHRKNPNMYNSPPPCPAWKPNEYYNNILPPGDTTFENGAGNWEAIYGAILTNVNNNIHIDRNGGAFLDLVMQPIPITRWKTYKLVVVAVAQSHSLFIRLGPNSVNPTTAGTHEVIYGPATGTTTFIHIGINGGGAFGTAEISSIQLLEYQ
jgi:hypothetical protein